MTAVAAGAGRTRSSMRRACGTGGDRGLELLAPALRRVALGHEPGHLVLGGGRKLAVEPRLLLVESGDPLGSRRVVRRPTLLRLEGLPLAPQPLRLAGRAPAHLERALKAH